jgi:hypothetical protein
MGGFTARWGGYALACYLGTIYDVVQHMFFGAVVADLGTWMCTAWLDIKAHPGPVIIEFVGFATLSQLILHTDLFEVPNDPASFGVAFPAFAAFFTIKGGIVVFQRLHS